MKKLTIAIPGVGGGGDDVASVMKLDTLLQDKSIGPSTWQLTLSTIVLIVKKIKKPIK